MDNKEHIDLYIIRGIPGSGKSTFARKLIGKGLADDHYEADMYFERGGKYRFDSSKLKNAHEWCRNSVKDSLKKNRKVVVSNTFTRLPEIYQYTDLCEELGKTFKIIRLTTNYGSIHNVPDETLVKMKARFQDYPGEILVK